jgi:hypothetical protein
MKRLDLWKAKLKTAKAELRIRERNLNASTRAYANCKREIIELDGIRLVKSLPERLGNRNDCLISLTCGMI